MYGPKAQVSGSTAPSVVKLDIGFTQGRKVLIGCLTAFGILVGVPVCVFGFFIGTGPLSGVGVLGFLTSSMFVLLALGLLALCCWAILHGARYGARLEGTELVVQHALRTKRVDLATARQVTLGSQAMEHVTMPKLHAQQDARGRSATIRLKNMNAAWIPPQQLHALANAIMAGQRPQPHEQQQAQYAAQGLYQVAGNPAFRMM